MIYSQAQEQENERLKNVVETQQVNVIVSLKHEDSEMTTEHPKDNEEVKDKGVEEARPISENEWLCEKCNQLNFIIYDDDSSCRCFNCYYTNFNI